MPSCLSPGEFFTLSSKKRFVLLKPFDSFGVKVKKEGNRILAAAPKKLPPFKFLFRHFGIKWFHQRIFWLDSVNFLHLIMCMLSNAFSP